MILHECDIAFRRERATCVTSPSRGEGGAPSLSPASIAVAIRGLRHEGLSDRGAPGGGDRPTRVTITPTRNAIGLSLPVSRAARDAIGKLSPWRSVLPPQGGGNRNAARKAKNFKEADRIRDELSAMGIQLKDSKDPATGEIVTTWEVKR